MNSPSWPYLCSQIQQFERCLNKIGDPKVHNGRLLFSVEPQDRQEAQHAQRE